MKRPTINDIRFIICDDGNLHAYLSAHLGEHFQNFEEHIKNYLCPLPLCRRFIAPVGGEGSERFCLDCCREIEPGPGLRAVPK